MVMSTLPESETIDQYISDGIETVYNFSFYVAPLSAGITTYDINVYAQAPNVEVDPQTQILVQGVDYSVTVPNPNPTFQAGFITLLGGPLTSGWILTLDGDVQLTITVNFNVPQTINGTTLNNAFLRLLQIQQQLNTFQQERCLSIKVNSYLPTIGQTQLDYLPDGYIYKGVNGAIIPVFLAENENVSTLRSELASQLQAAPGSSIIGIYNHLTSTGQTLDSYLTSLQNQNNGTDGAGSVGYYNPGSATPSTVRAALNTIISGGAGITYLTDTSGVANTLTCALTGYAAYVKGDSFAVFPNNTITGASTININSLGAKALITDLGPMIANEMLINVPYNILYDGTSFVVQNPTPAFYGCLIHLAANQVFPINVFTQIQFETVDSDPNNIYNVGTYTATPLREGFYEVSFSVECSGSVDTNALWKGIVYKNGVLNRIGLSLEGQKTISNSSVSCASVKIGLNGSTDTIQLWTNIVGSSSPAAVGGVTTTWCSINYIGR